MTRVLALTVRGALLGLLLAACGTSEQPSATPTPTEQTPTEQTSQTPSSPTSTPEPAPMGTEITTQDSQFGAVLFDGAGQAVYIWEVEEPSRPECYDDCAALWPPVLTDGVPVATGAVHAPLLGTVKRSDGARQITYNGHPLYYYVHEGPHEVTCHDVATHGGLWWAVRASGDRVV